MGPESHGVVRLDWLPAWLPESEGPPDRFAAVDCPLFRPDISPVGADRASVTRCRRSLAVAGSCCCCCQPADRTSGFPAWPRASASRCWKSPRLDVVQLGHGPGLTTEANVVPL